MGLLANGDAPTQAALSPLFRPLNLSAVRQLAAAALARRPRRQGRGRFTPDPTSGPDALEYCALIVSVAWHRETNDWPGQRNRMAAVICERLWRAAGDAPHGGIAARDGALTAWRRHLVAAQRYRTPHRAGALVERMLDDELSWLLPPQLRRPRRPPLARGSLSRWYVDPRSR
jgi:hypothetical protein